MSNNPRIIYLLKPAYGESIQINRTIKADDEWPFVVVVTDRDYLDDPSGKTKTVVFSGNFDSIDSAIAERDRQVALSLEDGFIINDLNGVPLT